MPTKVKFVEYGEQAKVKIVDWGEDIEVIPVEFGEQMRVKIVEWGEDLKVKITQDTGCFITTACAKAKGLPDNCVELNTLRKFRDQYVKSLSDGEKIIKHYYKIAPLIVKRIDQLNNSKDIYFTIWEDVLNCVDLINSNNYNKAMEEYYRIIKELERKFLLLSA